jgi:hypothetical protein
MDMFIDYKTGLAHNMYQCDQKEPKQGALSCTHKTYQREHNFILIAIVMKLKDALSHMMRCNAKRIGFGSNSRSS